MKTWIIILAALLVVSVVLNVILLVRMRRDKYRDNVAHRVMMSHFD